MSDWSDWPEDDAMQAYLQMQIREKRYLQAEEREIERWKMEREDDE